jgi:hypothetical protein
MEVLLRPRYCYMKAFLFGVVLKFRKSSFESQARRARVSNTLIIQCIADSSSALASSAVHMRAGTKYTPKTVVVLFTAVH